MNITLEQKSFTFHGVIGIVFGVLSGIMSKDPYQIPGSQILVLTLGVLFILYYASQRIFKLRELSTEQKKYDFKWFASNGIYPYLVFWLLAWIVIYNVNLF